MTDEPVPTASVEEKLLAKTAKHIQTLTRDRENEIAVDEIADNLRRTIFDSSVGATHNVTDMLVTHTKVLDGAFGWFLTRSEDHPEGAVNTMELALKSQQQVIRTLMAWKTIRDDRRLQDALERHRLMERNLAEQLRRVERKRYDNFSFESLHEKNEDERTEHFPSYRHSDAQSPSSLSLDTRSVDDGNGIDSPHRHDEHSPFSRSLDTRSVDDGNGI